jgi:hypothetical protein
VIAAVLGVLSVGAGLAAEVSNCNRDCSDGAGMMYGAFVFAGLGVGSLVLAIVPPAPGCATPTGSCSTQPVLGDTGPPAHTTAESSPHQLISRLSSSSLALIGEGWLITRPNEP